MSRTYNVLFLCTGNSARSIMAEAILNQLGQGRFRAWSAGSHPTGTVNPLALETLRRMRLPAEGLRSKSWDELATPAAPALDFVFTVCGKAAAEVCPVWPGRPMTAHWGVDDPAAVQGSDEAKRQAFWTAATLLRRRIELFLSLPLERIDALSLEARLVEIGRA
ncbi:MAG TPA: arsenate reductase ArsC [Anaeromyxobacteraceae bacterium]|nr:arsenate reductase ArsC [Anaeromyxobacteraceae bacterium]